MGIPGSMAAAAAVAATAAAVAPAVGDPKDSLFFFMGGISLSRESMRNERDILMKTISGLHSFSIRDEFLTRSQSECYWFALGQCSSVYIDTPAQGWFLQHPCTLACTAVVQGRDGHTGTERESDSVVSLQAH